MNENHIQEPLNSGKPWSEMDLLDLAWRHPNPVEEIAGFLCRLRREAREKIPELAYSREVVRRIEEATANALPDDGANRRRTECRTGSASI